MKSIGLIYSKNNKRVFLLPNEVKKLFDEKIIINIQTNYGKCLNIDDEQYKKVGGNIFPTYKQVILHSDIICKVDQFSKKECKYLNNKYAITMASYLNNVDMLYYMLKNNVTGLNWSCLRSKNDFVFFNQIEQIKKDYIFSKINNYLLNQKQNKKNKMLILNATDASIAFAKKIISNNIDVIMLSDNNNYINLLSNNEEIMNITKQSKCKFEIDSLSYKNLSMRFSSFNIFVNFAISPYFLTKTKITKQMVNSMPKNSLLINAANEYGSCFLFGKKKPNNKNKFISHNKNFYFCPANLCDFMPLESSKIISTNSLTYLLNACKYDINEKFTNTIICKGKKVIDSYVINELHLNNFFI